MTRREIRALRQEHIKVHIFKAIAKKAMRKFGLMRWSVEEYRRGTSWWVGMEPKPPPGPMGVGIRCAFPPYGTPDQGGTNCVSFTTHEDIISGAATIRTALAKMFADVVWRTVNYERWRAHDESDRADEWAAGEV